MRKLPEGWEVKKLQDICEILDKQRKPITKKDRIEGAIPYYGASGILSHVQDYIFNESLILLGEDGAKWESGDRSAFIIEGKTWVNNHAHVIRPNRNIIDDNWLVNYLNYENLMPFVTGMTVPKLNQGNMRNIPVPFPPLSEQKRIVAKLDEAFAAIDKAKANIEKNIENARELFQSKLNEVFSQLGDGWEEKRLGEIISIKHGFAFKSEFFSSTGSYHLLTPGNYFEEGGYKDRGEKQKYYIGEIPEGFILNKNDLLVAMTEQAPGLLGSPLLVPSENKFLHNQRLGLVEVNKDIAIEKEFLYWIFNTKKLRDEVYRTGSGVKVRHTSPTKICNVCVNIIKDEITQKKICETLFSLHSIKDESIKLYDRKITELDELKKSILQKAFQGEL